MERLLFLQKQMEKQSWLNIGKCCLSLKSNLPDRWNKCNDVIRGCTCRLHGWRVLTQLFPLVTQCEKMKQVLRTDIPFVFQNSKAHTSRILQQIYSDDTEGEILQRVWVWQCSVNHLNVSCTVYNDVQYLSTSHLSIIYRLTGDAGFLHHCD